MPDDCCSLCRCCPHVSCCCCDQRTGAIIIGFVLAAVGLALCIVRGLDLKYGYDVNTLEFATDVILLLTGVLLLIGILAGQRVLIKISLILMLILIVLYFVELILASIDTDKIKHYHMDGPFGYVITALIMIIALIYFFLVVLSYY